MEDEDHFQFADEILIEDDKKIYFGNLPDASIEYDENGADSLTISGSVGGGLVLSGSKLVLGSQMVPDTALAVAADSIPFFDADGTLKRDTIVDLAAGMAGAGLDASSGQLTVDLSEVIASDAANAVLTSDGDGTATGEANLTFDGSSLFVTGNIRVADDKKIYFGNDQDVSMEYDEDGTNTLLVSGDITMADDKKLYFGTGKDISLEYDEDGTDTLLISGTDVTIADDKKLYFGTDKDVHIEYDEDGDNVMVLSGGVKFADGATDVDIASHDTSNGLKLGGTLVTATAAELNYSDGVSSNIQTQLNTKVDTAGTALDISGTTMSLETDFLSNSSSAIGSGTASSYTASGSPTFISGKNTSTSTATFTVTVGGSGNTLDMGDGDGGTYDTFATFLPVGGSIAISSGTFSYVAVKMIPG